MQLVHCHQPQKKDRPAYALLMLLIVFAIGLVIYCIALNPPLDKETVRRQKESPDKYPWVEESRLLKSGQEPSKPSEKQPKINKTILLKSAVEGENESGKRGEIEVAMDTGGTVIGNWSGEYTASDINCVVMKADFKGNIDPSKIYEDKNGPDPSKLFFITKGRFLILETSFKTNKVCSSTGLIYVTGWIDHNYSVDGRITITGNKKTVDNFRWKARPLN